jgi:hypothetical protein
VVEQVVGRGDEVHRLREPQEVDVLSEMDDGRRAAPARSRTGVWSTEIGPTQRHVFPVAKNSVNRLHSSSPGTRLWRS